ncbi:hypothetical protein [Kitasatospora sp. NPDC085464]|uniref:hypothetical protein n=1 Tax=Kitasatospora sp. NPDC085464 TaxID=3364063 RepID=UPI0037C5C5C8
MARRTPRRIHVDGRDYRWTVRSRDAGHVVVRVWPDTPECAGRCEGSEDVGGRSRSRLGRTGGAGRPLEVTLRFDDPWLHYGVLLTAPAERIAEVFQLAPVTPALTAALVRAGLAAGWRPEQPGAPRRFTMDGGPADFTLHREE